MPGRRAPHTPVTTTGDGPPSWSSRSQFAVDSVCQMPFKSGFLSHDVRGIRPLWVCTGGWTAATNPTATTNADRGIRIGPTHLFCRRVGSCRADEERTPVRQRHIRAVCLRRAVPCLISGHLDLGASRQILPSKAAAEKRVWRPRLYGPFLGWPIPFLYVDMDPGVRVDPFDLRDGSRQLDWPVDVEFGGEGMVRDRLRGSHKHQEPAAPCPRQVWAHAASPPVSGTISRLSVRRRERPTRAAGTACAPG